MTSEEHNKLADQEAAEFFVWLDGYLSAMSARTPTSGDVFRITERTDSLHHRWRERGRNCS